jgi:hypothetical protein
VTPPEPDDGHVGDELPLLLGGELGRGRWAEVVGHLRQCASCRAELVDATGAHAALAAARRVLDPTVSRPVRPESVDDPGVPVELPPLTVRRTARRDLLVGLTAAVVAAAIALGGVALTAGRLGPAAGPRATAAQQARLVPVVAASGSAPAPRAAGVVRMSGSGEVVMTIHVTGLPVAAAGHFYYAWLLDPSTNKMLPVGVVDAAGSSTFDLGADLVKRYTAVDISLQADDGDPQHSPVSVLRASYAA